MSIAMDHAKNTHLAGIVHLPQSSGMRSTQRQLRSLPKLEEQPTFRTCLVGLYKGLVDGIQAV